MTDKSESVWVAIEMTYDYHEFQNFLGVAKTKEVAEQIANKYSSDYYPRVYSDDDHIRNSVLDSLAKEERGHVHIFKIYLSEGVDR